MKITHHPDPSTLMTCAAGSQPEALCAVVSSHLAMCKLCMSEVTRMEQIGSALLAEIEPERVASELSNTASTNAVLSEELASDQHVATLVPTPLRPALDNDFEALRWQSGGPGVWTYVVPMSHNAEGELLLVKLEPGRELPERAYRGEELLLVLRGSCHRDGTQLARGDYAESYDETPRRIIAGETEGCALLIAYERLPDVPGTSG